MTDENMDLRSLLEKTADNLASVVDAFRCPARTRSDCAEIGHSALFPEKRVSHLGRVGQSGASHNLTSVVDSHCFGCASAERAEIDPGRDRDDTRANHP